jgi:hypothetical protein
VRDAFVQPWWVVADGLEESSGHDPGRGVDCEGSSVSIA